MRQRPRRVFAAPFILTIAAGCTGPTRDVKEPDPDPDPVATPYQTWTVRSSGGEQCDAYVDVDCPPPSEATCNPPPPMVVACPAGLAEGDQVTVTQQEENGPCTAGDQPTECPSWETEQTE